MHFLVSLIVLVSLTTPNLAAVSCPTPTTCKGLAASVASALKGYPAAETLCTKKFPVPRQTCTSTAPAVTAVSTVATSTLTITVATATASTTAPTTTTTSTTTFTPTFTTTLLVTQTDTATTTTTTTVITDAKKRRSDMTARAVDPRASQLSSLASQASAFVGSVCTCLETAASTTINTTPTSTSRVTATVFSSVTATTTTTITPTATATSTITVDVIIESATATTTTTTTVTATATETVARATCSHARGDPDSRIRCNNGQLCDLIVTSCLVYPEGDIACFTSPECFNAPTCNFYFANSNCVAYADCCSNGLRLRQRDTRVFKRNEIFVKAGSLGDRVFNVPVKEIPE